MHFLHFALCLAVWQIFKRRGRADNHNTGMAESTIFPGITGNVNPRPNIVASTSGCATVTRGEVALTDREQITGLEIFRQSKKVQGVSSNNSRLLAAAWRKGTQSAYNSCWRYWSCWCFEEQIDPFCAVLEQIVNFLSALHTNGYEYRTINTYRSAISAFHPELNGK